MTTEDNALSKLLNEYDVARITGLSVASVRRWRLFKQGPRSLKLRCGGAVPPGRFGRLSCLLRGRNFQSKGRGVSVCRSMKQFE